MPRNKSKTTKVRTNDKRRYFDIRQHCDEITEREAMWRISIVAYPMRKGLERGHESGGSNREIEQENQRPFLRNPPLGKENITSYTNLSRLRLSPTTEEEKQKWRAIASSSECDKREVKSEFRGMDDVLSEGLDKGLEPERYRKERIKQLGNSVVPVIPYLLGKLIEHYEDTQLV
jgi:hypothetical protein